MEVGPNYERFDDYEVHVLVIENSYSGCVN
jgi:hypothetical protein